MLTSKELQRRSWKPEKKGICILQGLRCFLSPLLRIQHSEVARLHSEVPNVTLNMIYTLSLLPQPVSLIIKSQGFEHFYSTAKIPVCYALSNRVIFSN